MLLEEAYRKEHASTMGLLMAKADLAQTGRSNGLRIK